MIQVQVGHIFSACFHGNILSDNRISQVCRQFLSFQVVISSVCKVILIQVPVFRFFLKAEVPLAILFHFQCRRKSDSIDY